MSWLGPSRQIFRGVGRMLLCLGLKSLQVPFVPQRTSRTDGGGQGPGANRHAHWVVVCAHEGAGKIVLDKFFARKKFVG